MGFARERYRRQRTPAGATRDDAFQCPGGGLPRLRVRRADSARCRCTQDGVADRPATAACEFARIWSRDRRSRAALDRWKPAHLLVSEFLGTRAAPLRFSIRW